MQNPRKLKRHADLTDKMATARGIDLEESLMRGDIKIEDISDAVLRCTACSNPEHCTGWLEEQEGTTRTSPTYCRNATLFKALETKSR